MRRLQVFQIQILFAVGSNLFGNTNGQSKLCSWLDWKCDNGQCIIASKLCNGFIDCNDGSDETVEHCLSTRCPDTKFRCIYGGCIDKKAECNGYQDCADNSDELTAKCDVNYSSRLRGNCTKNEYQCKSGKCIPADNFCDGFAHCPDKSDETFESCAASCCSPSGFRCGYGACVDNKVKCNKIADCIDGSDENGRVCGNDRPQISPPQRSEPPLSDSFIFPTRRPVQFNYTIDGNKNTTSSEKEPETGACRITKVPLNGWIELLLDSSKKVFIGDYVDNFKTIYYSCLPNFYILSTLNASLCFNGQWSHLVPDCVPLCDSRIVNTYTIEAFHCKLNGNDVRCDEYAKPGTTIDVGCRPRYERLGRRVDVLTCTSSGIWSSQPFACTAICGEEAPSGTPYIVGGYETDIDKVPWHAAIYMRDSQSRYQIHCGGTILNERTILSAMHCFWDVTESAPYSDLSIFQVVVGKASLDFQVIPGERQPQYFDVQKIHYPNNYRDRSGNYKSDIVVLVLERFIIFKSHITPICVPYDLENADAIVQAGLIGRVAGFGLTSSHGEPSAVLKIVELPAVDRNECEIVSKNDLFLTDDKFCAGFVNINVSVCKGDSGGGLVFDRKEGQRKKYYIRGIVSTGPAKDFSCDSNRYTTFTNILFHRELITKHEPTNRPI